MAARPIPTSIPRTSRGRWRNAEDNGNNKDREIRRCEGRAREERISGSFPQEDRRPRKAKRPEAAVQGTRVYDRDASEIRVVDRCQGHDVEAIVTTIMEAARTGSAGTEDIRLPLPRTTDQTGEPEKALRFTGDRVGAHRLSAPRHPSASRRFHEAGEPRSRYASLERTVPPAPRGSAIIREHRFVDNNLNVL